MKEVNMNKYIHILLLMFLISCKQMDKIEINKTLHYTNNKAEVKVILTHMKIIKLTNNEIKKYNNNTQYKSFIYGEIYINNISDSTIVDNISKYYLKTGNILSSDINITSIAYRIIKNDTLAPGQMITKPVYWVFENAIRKDEIGPIELLLK